MHLSRLWCIRPEGPELELNQLGMIVQQEWMKSVEMRLDVELGEFVIMPILRIGNLVLCFAPGFW